MKTANVENCTFLDVYPDGYGLLVEENFAFQAIWDKM
jgi:hypothetical protein